MGENYYRHTWVEVDLDAVRHNVQAFRRHLPQQTGIMAVVKADGYGHGAVPVARESLAAGASRLCVGLVDEGLELRMAGITAPILLLGYISSDHVEPAVEHDITLTVFHEETIYEIEKAAAGMGKRAAVHLKIDTGMGRIGVRTKEELERLVQALNRCPHVVAEGVFTHFSCADEEDPRFTLEQHRLFLDLIRPYSFPVVHCSNSAAGILFPELGYNMIRLGISLYGQYPSPYTVGKGIELKPAFSLKSRISHVKELPAGSPVSYGRTYCPTQDAVIATVPIGYADGFPRALSNKGLALVRGIRVQVVGRVCMDQLMLDVSQTGGASVGDEVVLIGEQLGNRISVDDVADLLGTINYEVTCMIGKRVPRVYCKDGKKIMSRNSLI